MSPTLLLALQLSTAAFAGTLADLQPGQWTQLSGTQLRPLNPCPADNCAYSGPNSGFAGLMDAWNGGTFDTVGNRLLVWGGGHEAYYGNDLYAFDLDTGAWSQLIAPAPYAANSTHEAAGQYPDGSPISRHTYNSLVFVESQNTFMCTGAYARSPSGSSGDGRFWTVDFDGPATWSEVSPTDANTNIVVGYAAYNPATDTVYYHHSSGGRFHSYDPATDTHTYLAQKPLFIYAAPAVDPVRNRMLVLGGSLPQAFVWDLDATPPVAIDLLDNTTFTASGGGALASLSQMGLGYDAANDMYVAWDSGRTVYLIDAATFEVTTYTPTAGDDPGPPQNNGTYGRFQYAPDLGSFVLVNSVDSDVYMFTPPGDGSSQPVDSDWQDRASAPGVLMATRFDDPAEVFDWVHGDSTQDHVYWEQGNAASGGGALGIEVRADDGANSGNWRRWLSDDERSFVEGDVFYVSYRQYFPAYFATHRFLGGGGWKQSIISRNAGDMNGESQSGETGSNQLNEIVLNNNRYRSMVQGYNRATNGTYAGWQVSAVTACSSTDFIMQNAVDRGPQSVGTPCDNDRARYGGLYSYGGPSGPPDPLTGAFTYPQDGWATFKIRVELGSQGTSTANSHVQVWAARDGEDFELLIDRDDLDLGDGPAHNTLWLLPYDTGKQPDPSREDTYTLYDEVIVSLEDIAAPGFAVAPSDTTPPSVPSGLQADTTHDSISISWDPSTDDVGVTAYEVFVDGVLDRSVTSTSWTGSALSDTTYAITVRARDAAGNRSSPAAITVTTEAQPPLGGTLLGHWRLDQTSGLAVPDAVGLADGTITGSPTWASGPRGGALQFYGTESVQLGAVDVGPLDRITLATWVRIDSVAGNGYESRFISKSVGPQADDHTWMLGNFGDGTALRFRLKTNGSTTSLQSANGALPLGTWLHVAGTYDGTTMRIFVDGIEVGSRAATGSIPAEPTVSAALGNQPTGAGPRGLIGLLDDVYLFDAALSGGELLSLANDGVCPDADLDGICDADLHLEQTPIVPGQPMTFTVEGARPGARVYVLASTRLGATPLCHPVAAGVCTDLRRPTVLGTVRADAGGAAALTVPVPSSIPAGWTVYTQAAWIDGTDGDVTQLITTQVP